VSTASRRRFLFISNGHGEDGIAAAVIRALPNAVVADAYPMIGQGSAYAETCHIVGPRATLASEGWRNVKGSIRRDVASGGLLTIPPALRFLADVRGKYDGVVVVGDMVGILAGLVTGHRDLFYLDVYKTGAARLYSRFERMAIARTCATVYCRAPNLAEMLVAEGVDARCAGNVMMDTIPSGVYDARSRRRFPVAVTLLPGSRALTAESFALQVDALRALPAELVPDIFLAIAGGIDIERLAQAARLRRTPLLTAEPGDLGQMTDGRLVIHMARGGVLGNLLEASDFVLSQAGTATVQALGSGRPAITFINPRDRRSRFRDEQNLFGEARIVCPAEPEAVSEAVRTLLLDGAERTRLSRIGRERIGGPGAIEEIVAALAG
jgi:uncharacterized protein (TIGR03492 family)